MDNLTGIINAVSLIAILAITGILVWLGTQGWRQ